VTKFLSGSSEAERRLDRFELIAELASGGMATVFLARLSGAGGFQRFVAIKRLHPHLARDVDFATMFLDEARLAARIHHPNVATTVDVVASDGELFLVMEYILGESLSQLAKNAGVLQEPIPLRVVSSVMSGVLNGLHAAHEARTESGDSLHIVHRDVSPQNILVGVDGVARVVDFGVAKAAARMHSTQDGQIKGKLAYMAPEQIAQGPLDRRADVYAAGVVLWEALTLKRAFKGDEPGAVINSVLSSEIPAPSSERSDIPPSLDAVVRRAMSKDREERFATAFDFLVALEDAVAPAPSRDVAAWLTRTAGATVDARRSLVTKVELSTETEGRLPSEESGDASINPSARSASMEYPSLMGTMAWRDSRRRGARLGVAGMALFGALSAGIALGGYILWQASGRPAAGHASEPSSTAVLLGASAPPPPSIAPASQSVPSPAAPSVSQTATAESAAAQAPRAAGSMAVPSTRGTPPRATSATITPARSAVPAAPADCNPPFVMEANGVKRFKPQCM
jgi:serine/threonine-protein kinase